MKQWKIELTIEVSDCWIEDGFDLNTPESVETFIECIKENRLPYAYDHEFTVKAKVTKAPDTSVIRKLQGYDS